MATPAEMLSEVLAEDLTPVLTGLGLSPGRGARWRKGSRLEVRAILDAKGNDPFRGGAFALEFENSADGAFERKLTGRARLRQLVVPSERCVLLEVRNEIARGFERPPTSHVERLPESLRADHLRAFAPAAELESDI